MVGGWVAAWPGDHTRAKTLYAALRHVGLIDKYRARFETFQTSFNGPVLKNVQKQTRVCVFRGAQ